MSPKMKGSQPSARITIDGITAEQFDKLVGLLTEWITRGEVRIRLIMPSSIELEFDEANISRQLKQKRLPQGCLSQFRNDIPYMLRGILEGRRGFYTELIASYSAVKGSKDQLKPSKKQIREEVEVRIRQIEEKVVTPALRNQFAIKRSATSDNFVDVSWAIDQKRIDSTGSAPPDLVHATVRITTQKPQVKIAREELFIPFPFDFPGVTRYREIQDFIITMTLEDLQDMADKLGNAVKALRRVMEPE